MSVISFGHWENIVIGHALLTKISSKARYHILHFLLINDLHTNASFYRQLFCCLLFTKDMTTNNSV